MKTWYTADTHFGHKNIIDHCSRPFESVGHMDQAIMDNLYAHVMPQDRLYILGDFAFGPTAKKTEWLLGMFNRLPGAEKHLIVGNHDDRETRRLPWTSITHLVNIKDEGRRVTLCHYPMLTWYGARKGNIQLFGHVHENWRGSHNSVNVGVDVWDFMPITLDQAIRRAKTQQENPIWSRVERVESRGT